MTREIKFRAWYPDRKNRMSYFSLIQALKNIATYNCEEQIECLDYEDIMQYTGLKDKNGKEIYEGDIIKYKNYICEIMYKKAHFLLWNKRQVEPLSNISEEIEIKGNIYENPELLN